MCRYLISICENIEEIHKERKQKRMGLTCRSLTCSRGDHFCCNKFLTETTGRWRTAGNSRAIRSRLS